MATALSLLRFAPLPPRLNLPRVHHFPVTVTTPFSNPTPNSHHRNSIPPRVRVIASYSNVPTTDRLLSAVSYTLPFLNSLPYGRLFISRYPLLASLTSPFLPLLSTFRSLPHAQFLAFFLLYLALARNPNMSRYVRFNAMQAVLLDVILSLPLLFRRFISTRLLQFGYGAIFLLGFVTFFYGVFSCLLGRTPYLPFLSSAVDGQL